MSLCGKTTGSVGPSCDNRFESHYTLDFSKTRVGLRFVCSSSIPKGTFSIEYLGKVMWEYDAVQRDSRRYQVEKKTQVFWCGASTFFIDAVDYGSESRYINHSCKTYCELYDWEWANTVTLGIFAAEDIPSVQR
ncbi:uncharacterized protein PITG_01162 [Phytophthora infestans T30-4]|uniref:SET domain-containing protein n=1 Tax=Phytophthora infestans (strain T30-4) TaxID=403677 RepID=D0MUS9_PHYIT|nr:uncharacterized protein PITG_01162 [Phytophthora infestans T30-4]EEY60925.1 hypothetical protein PITG_01162 [Phytophthora infestans T30-4]|eukprot:XP_002907842.1 hypothetical protein PITG_01162 [Phytophthora infestans T30-4]